MFDVQMSLKKTESKRLNEFSELVGMTIVNVLGKKGGDEIHFELDNGDEYRLHHSQYCCESVYVEDVCGEWGDIVGYPILKAEESSNSEDEPAVEYSESYTWTFYHLATIRGSVTIRFFGSSNGYYSERVTFSKA